MKMRFLILAVAVALMTLAANSQPRGETVKRLTFTISPVKDRVILLEPIPLKFTVENRADSPIPFDGPLSISLPSLKLIIERPDGSVVRPHQLSWYAGRIVHTRGDLPSGATWSGKELLEFELHRHFDRPGNYRIQATFNSGDTSLSSGWVNLTVEQPAGAAAVAYEYLRERPEKGLYWYTAAEREEFLERFPESPYSDYFRYALALNYSNQNIDKAIEMLRHLRDTKPDFVYASQVAHELARLEGVKDRERRSRTP